MRLEVLPDREALAQRAAEFVVEAAARAIGERGQFTFAISGGSTPRRMLEVLAERDDIEWNRVYLFQVDERIAPDGEPDRNATMLSETLLSDEMLGASELGGVFLMPVTDDDLEAAASAYAETMDRVTGSPIVFDLIQLGLGDDGHTASLIPGDPILELTDRAVGLSDTYRGRRRMSMTWPVLDRAKELLWVVAGESKRVALESYLDNDPSIPATLPTQARATVLVSNAL